MTDIVNLLQSPIFSSGLSVTTLLLIIVIMFVKGVLPTPTERDNLIKEREALETSRQKELETSQGLLREEREYSKKLVSELQTNNDALRKEVTPMILKLSEQIVQLTYSINDLTRKIHDDEKRNA